MKHHAGFTLIEALIVLVVVGTVAIVGIPMISTAFADYRIGDAGQILSGAVQRARFMATSQNCTAVLAVSNSGNITVYREEDGNVGITNAKETENSYPFYIPETVKVLSINFGTYSGYPNNQFLIFSPDGLLVKPQTEPPVDTFDNTVRRASLQFQTDDWATESDIICWVRVTKFGELLLKQ